MAHAPKWKQWVALARFVLLFFGRKAVAALPRFALLYVGAIFVIGVGGFVFNSFDAPKETPRTTPRTPLEKRGDEAFAKLFGLETCNEEVRLAREGNAYAGRLVKTRVCYTPKGTMRAESWVESSAGWVKIFDELR